MNNYYTPYPYQNYQQPQSNFISVRSEEEARNYPVAPGNSVTFISETQPYCYTKTMGMSQFDRPRFEKFKMVKEEEVQEIPYALKSDVETMKAAIIALEDKIATLSETKAKKAKKEGEE